MSVNIPLAVPENAAGVLPSTDSDDLNIDDGKACSDEPATVVAAAGDAFALPARLN